MRDLMILFVWWAVTLGLAVLAAMLLVAWFVLR